MANNKKLNVNTSVVDYLKSTGQDSSLTNRITLGKKYGIDYSSSKDNYATQNSALLNSLKGASNGGGDTTITGNPTNTKPINSDITNPNDFINGNQASDFNNASTIGDPTVKGGDKSPVDYKSLITNFKEAITGGKSRPDIPNLKDTYKGYRDTYGVTDLEKSINNLKAKKQLIEDNVNNLNYDEAGKPVALNVISGRQTEEQRQANLELQTINRDLQNATDELTTKYNVIDSLMSFTQTDYANSVNTYDSQFSKNMQLFNVVKGISEAQKTDKEKVADTARANLQIIYNGIGSGTVDSSKISNDMKATITKLELQSGLPVGFYKNLKNKNIGSDILSTTTRQSDGNKYVDVILKNSDGSLSTKSMKLGAIDPKNISTSDKLKADVVTAINQFKTIIKKNNWAGVNPDDYNTMKDYIFNTYGTTGLDQLTKAMELQNIYVDNG